MLIITVIDGKGNMLFEPIECNLQYVIRAVSGSNYYVGSSINCGLIVLYGNCNTTIINTSGEIITEINDVSVVSAFSEDAAIVRNIDIRRDFVDVNGIYYIDKTGNRLF